MIQTTPSSAKKTRVTWKRVFLLFALVIAGMAAVAWFWEPWYFAHEFAHGNPNLAIMPQPLRITDRSKLQPSRLQPYGYSFQTPWEQMANPSNSHSAGIFWFKGGPTIITFDPSLLSSVSAGLQSRANQLRSIFGPRAMSSRYNWLEAELTANPEDVHWWNRTGNVRAAILLGLKETEVSDSTTVIHRIQNDEMHGFQLGDPAKPPYRVKLELFDVNDRRYEILISWMHPSTSPVTQADINAIIASIRPIPHS